MADIKMSERRDNGRKGFARDVTIQFSQVEIVGPGQNISPQGVFFVADTTLRVKVKVDGVDGDLEGELVRVQAMGEDRVGVAVRFLEPLPDLDEV